MGFEITPEIAIRIDQLLGDAYASPEEVLGEALSVLEHRDANLTAMQKSFIDKNCLGSSEHE